MNNVVVGEDITLPRSYRSQIAHSSIAETKISISPVGVDVPTTRGRCGHRRTSIYRQNNKNTTKSVGTGASMQQVADCPMSYRFKMHRRL